jgi:hypothetical protein
MTTASATLPFSFRGAIAYNRFVLNPIADRLRKLRLTTADHPLLLRDLLRHIDRDIPHALQLTRKSPTVDKPTRTNKRQLIRRRRKHVVLTFDDLHATFRARRHTPTYGLHVNPVILRKMHDALTRLRFKLDILWNELHFHVMSP